jgi:DNA-binding HxlR family transcriptional regulator
MSRRYLRKHSGPILELLSRRGMTVRRLCAQLGVHEKCVRRALEELRLAGLVHPTHTRLAYPGKWPELGDPVLASVLRRLRRRPMTRDELRAEWPDVPRKEIDSALHYLTKRGYLAPACLVWASTFEQATR